MRNSIPSDPKQLPEHPTIKDAGRPPLDNYGELDQSPVLIWLPIFAGLLASGIVALAFCPVPRLPTLSATQALFLGVAYVVGTVVIGAGVLAICNAVVAKRGVEVSIRRVLPLFSCVVAWITPTLAFYVRDSLWAASGAFVLAVLGSRLIHRYQWAASVRDMYAATAEQQVTESFQTARRASLTVAVFLLQFAALSIVAEMPRPATVLIGCAIFVIGLFPESAFACSPSHSQSTSPKAGRFAMTLGVAIILVIGSLAPYLAMATDDANSADTTPTTHRSLAAKPAGPKASFLQFATSFLRRLLGEDLQATGQEGHAGRKPVDRPYRALQALFGSSETAGGSESSFAKKKSNKGKPTALVSEDVSPGVILRPKVEDYLKILPPLPRRWTLGGRPTTRAPEQVSIPFYGAYWFYRSADETLPPDAVEVRGDPASTSFKTTDFTPISMEARQNFGALIDLSCCRAIELVISNGDRRPGTVAVELILTNTRLTGEPSQSLGISPVNSTLRWFPGDDRPPVTEVLTFRLPAQSAIQRFDEAIIRFELQSPRERWSAKIAIEKFRLIPRGF